MEKWGMFEFNSPYFGEIIEKINDVVLPNDYIELMKKHNGGEGDIGETWLILYPLEELQEIMMIMKLKKFCRVTLLLAQMVVVNFMELIIRETTLMYQCQ